VHEPCPVEVPGTIPNSAVPSISTCPTAIPSTHTPPPTNSESVEPAEKEVDDSIEKAEPDVLNPFQDKSHDRQNTKPAIPGTSQNPFWIISDESSDEEELEMQNDDEEDEIDVDEGFTSGLNEVQQQEQPIDLTQEDIVFGTEFEKVDSYDHYLDEPNPWHPDLARPLFPAQIIGFRWMVDRHAVGGGLVADKVGCGKVNDSFWLLTSRHTRP